MVFTKATLSEGIEACEKVVSRPLSLRVTVLLGGFLSLFFIGLLSFRFILMPPADFPAGRIVTIENGASLRVIAQDLQERGVIRHADALVALLRVADADNLVMSGDYFFTHPLTVNQVAYRIVRADYGITPVIVRLQEGDTIEEMAHVLSSRLEGFDDALFVSLAHEQNLEGYLFPDTYQFLPNIEPQQVINEMKANFIVKMKAIKDVLIASKRSINDLIIMASIIEEEAWKSRDRRLISGVLWNRLDINMPLQVDSTFLYINGKNTYELTYADLAIESDYNTYKKRGLPPGPISNPSLDSIVAAAQPISNEYLYYLADLHGNTYYSETFMQHKYYKSLYIP